MNSSWINELLGADHARIDDLFHRMVTDPEAAREMRRSLELHIAWEENHLFPAVQQAKPTYSQASLESLRIDHERILAALDRYESAVASGIAQEIVESFSTLEVLMIGHNRDEEIGIYAEADRMLGEAARESLLRLFVERKP